MSPALRATYFEVKTWVGLYARHPKEWKRASDLPDALGKNPRRSAVQVSVKQVLEILLVTRNEFRFA